MTETPIRQLFMLEQDLEFIYQSLIPRTKIQISNLGECSAASSNLALAVAV